MRAPSSRALARLFVLGTAIALAPAALAGDPKPAPKPPPVMASDEAAAAAVAEFKEAYKAKGLKGEDKTSQRDFAMATLAKLQHPLVVEALGPVSRDSDAMLRMLATIYLGDQTLLPGLAGKNVAAAWKRGVADDVYVMTAMQSIAKLRYLGARDDIRGALKSQNFAVKKTAIGTIVMTGDLRMVRDMLALVGVQVPSGQGSGAANSGGPAAEAKDAKSPGGGTETTTEGYSWEGAEATVDYGMSDNTQENAEAKAKAEAQIAQNKAAAEAAAGGGDNSPAGGGVSGGTGGGAGGSVGGGSNGGSAPGRGGGGRSNSELIPLVLGALEKLTGVKFTGPAHFKKWWGDNAEAVAERMKKLDDKEKFQKEEASAQSK
jgi:hypothetical protein